MIAFLKGKIDVKGSNFIIIEVNGVGYKVFMTDSSLQQIETKQEIKVYTYMRVLEDDVSLYGFLNNEELSMFELLIGVGGIGAKSAIAILSNIEPSSFALAVITDDVATLKKLPGIGAKTAQRIILELKDKIKSNEKLEQEKAIEEKAKLNEKAQDAIDALQVLGYNIKSIETVLAQIDTENLEVEEIIKQGLKLL